MGRATTPGNSVSLGQSIVNRHPPRVRAKRAQWYDTYHRDVGILIHDGPDVHHLLLEVVSPDIPNVTLAHLGRTLDASIKKGEFGIALGAGSKPKGRSMWRGRRGQEGSREEDIAVLRKREKRQSPGSFGGAAVLAAASACLCAAWGSPPRGLPDRARVSLLFGASTTTTQRGGLRMADLLPPGRGIARSGRALLHRQELNLKHQG